MTQTDKLSAETANKLQTVSDELMSKLLNQIGSDFKVNHEMQTIDYALNILMIATAKLLNARNNAYNHKIEITVVEYSGKLLNLINLIKSEMPHD